MRILEILLDNMEGNGLISSDEDRMVKRYGMELFFNACVNTMAILLIGCLLSCPLQAAIFYFTYVSLKKDTGGYHANSHIGCILQFNGTCLILFLLYQHHILRIHRAGILIFLLLCVFLFAPVISLGKRLPTNQENRHRRYARIKVILAIILLFILEHWIKLSPAITGYIYLGLLMVGATVILGEFKNKYLKRKQK